MKLAMSALVSAVAAFGQTPGAPGNGIQQIVNPDTGCITLHYNDFWTNIPVNKPAPVLGQVDNCLPNGIVGISAPDGHGNISGQVNFRTLELLEKDLIVIGRSPGCTAENGCVSFAKMVVETNPELAQSVLNNGPRDYSTVPYKTLYPNSAVDSTPQTSAEPPVSVLQKLKCAQEINDEGSGTNAVLRAGGVTPTTGACHTQGAPPHSGNPTASVPVVVRQPVRILPTIVFLAKPKFSFSDKVKYGNYQGTALVSVVVDVNGSPQQIKIRGSLGNSLDKNAVEAVHRYVFTPATVDGKPVSSEVNVNVTVCPICR
jgi:TonB family protein